MKVLLTIAAIFLGSLMFTASAQARRCSRGYYGGRGYYYSSSRYPRAYYGRGYYSYRRTPRRRYYYSGGYRVGYSVRSLRRHYGFYYYGRK